MEKKHRRKTRHIPRVFQLNVTKNNPESPDQGHGIISSDATRPTTAHGQIPHLHTPAQTHTHTHTQPLCWVFPIHLIFYSN